MKQIEDGEVINGRVPGKPDLAGPAVGVACPAPFHLLFKMPESPFVQGGLGKSLVPGKTTATYLFGEDGVGSQCPGHLPEFFLEVHFRTGAGYMKSQFFPALYDG